MRHDVIFFCKFILKNEKGRKMFASDRIKLIEAINNRIITRVEQLIERTPDLIKTFNFDKVSFYINNKGDSIFALKLMELGFNIPIQKYEDTLKYSDNKEIIEVFLKRNNTEEEIMDMMNSCITYDRIELLKIFFENGHKMKYSKEALLMFMNNDDLELLNLMLDNEFDPLHGDNERFYYNKTSSDTTELPSLISMNSHSSRMKVFNECLRRIEVNEQNLVGILTHLNIVDDDVLEKFSSLSLPLVKIKRGSDKIEKIIDGEIWYTHRKKPLDERLTRYFSKTDGFDKFIKFNESD